MDTDEVLAAAQPFTGLLIAAQVRHACQTLETAPGDADLEDLQTVDDLLGVLGGTLDLKGDEAGVAFLLFLLSLLPVQFLLQLLLQ